MSLSFATLQAKALERGVLWGNPGLEFRVIEVGGETGELLEAMKKHLRFLRGMKGGVESIQPVKDEIADVIISAVQLANDLDVNLTEAIPAKFNQTSDKYGFPVKILPTTQSDIH